MKTATRSPKQPSDELATVVYHANIVIIEVLNKRDLKRFINFPHDLYATDPNYVPELQLAVKELLNPKKNPFFKHSKADLFLALKNGQVVGRIAAIRNNKYNEFHQCNVGFFGFFDVIEDFEVAEALLDTACDWNKSEGFTTVLGPTNFTTNDTAGLLINGFDEPPVVQMTYNKPYYVDFIRWYGFAKEMDLYAYWIPTQQVSEKSLRLANQLEKRLTQRSISFRPLNLKRFLQEVKGIKKVYNTAWEKNWGFVPPTTEEFDFLAQGLKMVLDPRYSYVAEHQGEIVGFAVGLPNINEILLKNKRGRLFPFGFFRLLWGKRKVKTIRVILLGVLPAYRKLGIEALFFSEFIKTAKANGLLGWEASWILENNHITKAAAENNNGKMYKTYRIYKITI